MKKLIGKKENYLFYFLFLLQPSIYHSIIPTFTSFFPLLKFRISPNQYCVLLRVLAWKDVKEDKEAIVKAASRLHGCDSRLGDGFCIKFQHNK
jgi:hypothetical protein